MNVVISALAVTFGIQAALAAGIYAPPTLAPSAHAELGVRASAVGLFTALSYLCAALSSALGGPLIARLGPMRVSQICLGLCALGLFAVATAWLPLVLVGAILIGMAYGPATPASSQILVALTPARLRATILSLKQTGVPAGGVAVGAFVPAIASSLSWRGAVVALGLVCTVLALGCEAVRERLDASGGRASPRHTFDPLEPLRLAREDARLRQLASVAFLYSGAQLCFATYLVVYLVEVGQVSLYVAGAGMSMFMLGGIVGRILWGALADATRQGRKVLAGLGAGSGLMALTLIGLTPGWSRGVALVACVLCGITAIAWNGVQLAEVARRAPEGRIAAATGMSMVFSYLGVVVAPLLFWLLHTLTGTYAAGFALSASFSFLGAIVLWRDRGVPYLGEGMPGSGFSRRA